MSRTFKLAVNRASDSSTLSHNWVEVQKVSSGIYKVADYRLTGNVDPYGNNALGFREWDHEVEDLDAGNSDGSSCFDISNHLRWNDVDLTPGEFRATSLRRLKEALTHVTFCVWDQDEI